MSSPALARIHRWVALVLGAFIAVIGATGAALVFRDELTPLFTPAAIVSSEAAPPGAYERILASARKVDPGAHAIDISIPARQDRAVEAIIRRPASDRYLFIDPHDGAVRADSDREFLPFPALFQLHQRLLAGKRGEYLVGLLGIALAFLGLSGVVLWWPRKLANAFRVRWQADRLALNYDLHRCAGAAFAVVLVTNAAIGVAMAFDETSVAVVNRIAGSRPPAPLPPVSLNAPAAGRSLDEIVAAAERALPEGVVRRISLRGGSAPVQVRKRLASDNATHGMNRIYVDAASATVLQVRRLADQPAGNAMFEWLYPLHTGTLLGTPYRLLLVVAGCIPLVSLATGFIVWRTKAKRRSAARMDTPRR